MRADAEDNSGEQEAELRCANRPSETERNAGPIQLAEPRGGEEAQHYHSGADGLQQGIYLHRTLHKRRCGKAAWYLMVPNYTLTKYVAWPILVVSWVLPHLWTFTTGSHAVNG
jgi:hypothetical protein